MITSCDVSKQYERCRSTKQVFCLNEEKNEAAVDLHVKLAVAFHEGKCKVKSLQDEAMAVGGPGANEAAEKAVESYRGTRFGGWLPTLMGNTQCWVHLQG